MSTTINDVHINPIKNPRQLQYSLHKYWQYYADKGRDSHLKGQLKVAADCFIESIRISKALIVDEPNESQPSGMELLYIASHNLASCYNGRNQGIKGESILRDCHNIIINFLLDDSHSKALRLESLCVLKRSLFSLSSQLAFMNKPSEIHELISKTERIADSSQAQLDITAA